MSTRLISLMRGVGLATDAARADVLGRIVTGLLNGSALDVTRGAGG